MDWLDLLVATQPCSDYKSWIQLFSTSLWKKCGWKHLHKLSNTTLIFSETLLIPFIELLLKISKETFLPGLLKMLDDYFKRFAQEISSTQTITSTIYTEKRIVNTMLQIVECIRIHNTWLVFLCDIN